jgi:two-component system CheB/CheR fusion protein
MVGKKTNEKQKKKTRPAQKSSDESTDVIKSPPAPARRRLTKVKLLKNDKDFHIVGIGASAGGLEAFEEFFTHMPADSGMAFVLIPHLAPLHKSIMVDLLKRYTKMEIFEVKDGMEVKPNCVYIIPPNKDMSILHRKLQLLQPVESKGIRHPIDFFFRSLAAEKGEKAICIILSGTGTEGTLGLKDIKGEGGLVLVQEPKTSKYEGMPSSAISTGLADYVLPAKRMPEYLLRYVRGVYTKPPKPPEKPGEKVADPLQKIFILIRALTGHDFSLYKQNTIIRRIERRMTIHQIDSLSNYVTYLRTNPHEVETLSKDLLIRVTNFFRDPDAFEILTKKILPHIFKNKSYEQPIRIWVPGCTTGEEAYTIAIIIREHIQNVKGNFRVQIFGTDIDSEAIETARTGTYPDTIAVDISPERLRRYFVKEGSKYKIKDEIREMVVFAAHNLIKDPPFSKMDLISCRNVLIYMGSELQKRVIPLFHYALNPDGILFLGSSETIGDHADMFSVIDKKWKIFEAKKVESVPAELPDFRSVSLREKGPLAKPALEIKGPVDLNIAEFTQKLLLEYYSPPCVIVNERGDILYFHGRTGKYLEPAPGRAALNIAEMAREGLRFEVRAALGKAVIQKKDITFKGLNVKTDGGFQTVNLEVKYIGKPEHLRGLFMVVFNEVSSLGQEKAERSRYRPSKIMNKRISELEFELKSARAYLQSTIEELEASNEELKSTNEELQSSNEELQSTNEELDTSREELQSVNEELTTVNSELQNKIDELTEINSDMSNLLASTQIATIFLNNELHIRRFTPAITNVINLIETDVGRPVSDIVSKLEYSELIKDVKEVLKTLTLKEREVRHLNGHWYLIRILPYRTIDNVIDGVVITFMDITEQKRVQEVLEDALTYAKGILETVREPLVVLDKNLRIMSANRSFYQVFKVSPEDTKNGLIYEIGNRQWDIPALRELLETIVPENTSFHDFMVENEFPIIGRKKILLNARGILQKGKQTQLILLAMEDVTEK